MPQQLLLMQQSPIFEFISAETLAHQRQKKYYQVLEKCDQLGDSTQFIEFSLENIRDALKSFHQLYQPVKATQEDRLKLAQRHFGRKTFSINFRIVYPRTELSRIEKILKSSGLFAAHPCSVLRQMGELRCELVHFSSID